MKLSRRKFFQFSGALAVATVINPEIGQLSETYDTVKYGYGFATTKTGVLSLNNAPPKLWPGIHKFWGDQHNDGFEEFPKDHMKLGDNDDWGGYYLKHPDLYEESPNQ